MQAMLLARVYQSGVLTSSQFVMLWAIFTQLLLKGHCGLNMILAEMKVESVQIYLSIAIFR